MFMQFSLFDQNFNQKLYSQNYGYRSGIVYNEKSF